ncbi:MvaI/BcnI family restriction endonuclease [Ruficoccus sp. ZRK36]|uniref:MvaI/BcnI family restriction endonuclease n=1 Tax=Ruficoccus sp. ZRK36 TaxID=2866311 RepID=UPI001C737F51|nr:MvaI/BcnI family restriction endonuclease [Ruficoccus sp. ZRK36]QYY36466.1 MvaI/BcnI restriction endonuclease family protein [Ruficoccus sp. ZRK36]
MDDISLSRIKYVLTDLGAKRIFIKKLAPNDNSKNQVYLAGNLSALNILPYKGIQREHNVKRDKWRYKAPLDLFWVGENGQREKAPDSQLILYPQYPEVRMSGFLKRCKLAPSSIMASRDEGRILVLGICDTGEILAYACGRESRVARELESQTGLECVGVFLELLLSESQILSPYQQLIAQLRRIHECGWINSKRLLADGSTGPCEAPNCGGYTLEAELGVIPNGRAEPDYLGWEIKQYNVARFDPLGVATITLMTPEPTGGYYAEQGVEAFLRKYGYPDKRGRPDRMNFGGVHKANSVHAGTGLFLKLDGYCPFTNKITDFEGGIVLTNGTDIAAKWPFPALVEHWSRKHAQAAYIPSMCQVLDSRQYQYGGTIFTGRGTDFTMFLSAMSKDSVYYDPGIKGENWSTGRAKIKRRSQFRINSRNLGDLYNSFDAVELLAS